MSKACFSEHQTIVVLKSVDTGELFKRYAIVGGSESIIAA